jgi:hypothetical protein
MFLFLSYCESVTTVLQTMELKSVVLEITVGPTPVDPIPAPLSHALCPIPCSPSNGHF